MNESKRKHFFSECPLESEPSEIIIFFKARAIDDENLHTSTREEEEAANCQLLRLIISRRLERCRNKKSVVKTLSFEFADFNQRCLLTVETRIFYACRVLALNNLHTAKDDIQSVNDATRNNRQQSQVKSRQIYIR